MGTTITAAQWLNAIINVFLPILVALVTAKLASGGLKSVVLLALSAVSGYLVAWLDAVNHDEPFNWSQATFTFGMGFIVAVAMHFGLWKPAGVTGNGGKVQGWAPGGLGDPRP